MARIWLCCILGLMACAPVRAGGISPHAKKAVETIQQLRAIGIPSEDLNHPSAVSAPPDNVPGLLHILNQELKALIIEDLNDQSLQQFPPDGDEILNKLRAAGWEETPNTKWGSYGEIEQVIFDQYLDYNPSLIVVTTQLWVPCGSSDPDSAIYVFQGSGRHWKLIMERVSDFDPTSESEGSGLAYKLSPTDSHGHWFMVIARVPATCRRNHTIARFEALRPGEEPTSPIILIAGRQPIDTFFDPPFRIEAEAYSFSITFGKVRKLDGQPGLAVTSYAVGNSSGSRIAPLAETPVDFLDQWIQMEWEDVKRWANDDAANNARGWHEKLGTLAPDSVEIESAQKCPDTEDGTERWLLELSVDQRPNPSMQEVSLFVDITRRGRDFYFAGAHNMRPTGCPGTTAIEPILDRKALRY